MDKAHENRFKMLQAKGDNRSDAENVEFAELEKHKAQTEGKGEEAPAPAETATETGEGNVAAEVSAKDEAAVEGNDKADGKEAKKGKK